MQSKINIGINGFGRIGKCILKQLVLNNNNKINLVAINAPSFDLNNLYTYINYDSTHKTIMPIEMSNIYNNIVYLDDHNIKFFNERDPSKINWKLRKTDLVIDATGTCLTADSANKHSVDKVVLCAPPKDPSINQYVYGVNHNKYENENIISGSSCTTNSITPLLYTLNKYFGIENGNFTTIHAATASQSTLDTCHMSHSVFNNIIPHKTGASKAIDIIIPEIEGKIHGTSVRVPTNNVSLIDLNVQLTKKTNLKEIMATLYNHNNTHENIMELSGQKLVSSNFMTTTKPTIIDTRMSMALNNNSFKLFVWYDNEWSYSAQIIKLITSLFHVNK